MLARVCLVVQVIVCSFFFEYMYAYTHLFLLLAHLCTLTFIPVPAGTLADTGREDC